MSLYVECDNTRNGLTWKALFNLMAQVTTDSCVAMNTVESEPCETPPPSVNNRKQRPDGSFRLRPDGSYMLRP